MPLRGPSASSIIFFPLYVWLVLVGNTSHQFFPLEASWQSRWLQLHFSIRPAHPAPVYPTLLIVFKSGCPVLLVAPAMVLWSSIL
jgi:hypothetical protein